MLLLAEVEECLTPIERFLETIGGCGFLFTDCALRAAALFFVDDGKVEFVVFFTVLELLSFENVNRFVLDQVVV